MQPERNEDQFQEKIFAELNLIKKQLFETAGPSHVSLIWVPRKDVMEFFSYGDTQMAALEKSGQIIVAKVGKRKFIHRDSIAKLLDSNIINPQSTPNENKA
jgi:hypothetical protein